MADTKFSALPSVTAGATDVVPVVQGGTPSRVTPLSIAKTGQLNPTGVKAFADSPVSAAAGDLVVCDTTNGNITVTLPTAPADKTLVCIKHILRGSTNTITVNTGGTDVINRAGGATTFTITLLGQDSLLQYQTSTGFWYILAAELPLSQLDARYPAGSGTSTGTNTGDQTSVSGNAGTATKLATARNINGVAFDGSADITVADSTKVPTTTTVNGHALSGNISVTTTDLSLNNLTNDAQIKAADFPAASVDSEVVIFSSTTGKVVKRASASGIAKLTSGVLSAVTAPSGAIVGDTDTQTLTNKRVTKRVVTVTQSATPTMNTDNTDVGSITALAQAITSMTTNLTGTPVAGDRLLVEITDNGTARAITWGAKFESSTVTLPATTVISTKLSVLFIWNTVSSAWRCVAVS